MEFRQRPSWHADAVRGAVHPITVIPARQATLCPTCGLRCIGRDGYRITTYELGADGACKGCGTPVAGVFAGKAGSWGPRRQPGEIERYAA